MPKKHRDATTRIQGKLIAFNISPKGHAEGALVETASGEVQVNFPKPRAEELASSMKPGEPVDLPCELDNEDFAHPVYRVIEEERGADRQGRIARLNYALHGEVNGFHLADGTFVHLKPEGAKKVRPKVGDAVVVVGVLRHGRASDVIEAKKVRRVGNADAATQRA